MSTVLVGVDTGVRDLAGVDHVVHRLDHALADLPDRASYVASTHVVPPGGPHHAVAVGWEAAAPVSADSLLPVLVEAFPQAAVVVDDGVQRLTAGPTELVDGAGEALRRHDTQVSGRLARFPGQSAVERRLTAAEVVADSFVDEVAGLAGTDVGPDTEVDLTGFVRPTWRDGRCTVLVQPAAAGLVPFEAAHQIACCSDH